MHSLRRVPYLISNGPTVVVAEKVNSQLCLAIRLPIVVVDKHIGIVVLEDSVVTGSTNSAMRCQDHSTATRHHVDAVAVNVRALNVSRSADPDVVGTSSSLAAPIERDPKIVVVAVPHNDGCLDGTAASAASNINHAGA